MKFLTRSCPRCGAQLEIREILAAGPFPCSSCHAQLQAPESYVGWIGLGNVLALVSAFGLLGLRGLHLLGAVLVAWFPIQFVALGTVKYVLPPKVVEYLPQDSTLRLRGGRG